MLLPYLTKNIEKIIAKYPQFIKLYSIYYKNLVDKEIKLCKINKKDKILCIGGGPVPLTAIEFSQRTKANINVVDNDPLAVSLAEKVIELSSLKEKIQVNVADGRAINPKKYSVIHIARQVCPHEKIFKNIWENAKDGTKIILRCPKNKVRNMYNKLMHECNCDKCFCINGISYKDGTLLFIKGIKAKKKPCNKKRLSYIS